MARYRIQHQWPVAGIVIEGGTVIDTSEPHQGFLSGAVPPPDSLPLDEDTRKWLVFAYREHGVEIAPVPPTEVQIEETNKSATRKSRK
jgi:hypothetical protein